MQRFEKRIRASDARFMANNAKDKMHIAADNLREIKDKKGAELADEAKEACEKVVAHINEHTESEDPRNNVVKTSGRPTPRKKEQKDGS